MPHKYVDTGVRGDRSNPYLLRAPVSPHIAARREGVVIGLARIVDACNELRSRAERTRKTVPTLTIDTRVRFASADAQHAFATELANAVAGVLTGGNIAIHK